MTDPIKAALITAVVALLGAGGVIAWIKLRPETRKLEADTGLAAAQADRARDEVVILLGKTAAEMLAPLRDEVAAVRAEAGKASEELAKVRVQLRRALEQVDSLKEVLRRWHRLIHDDNLNMLQLREAIRADKQATRLHNGKH